MSATGIGSISHMDLMEGIFEGLTSSAVMTSFKTAELIWRKTVEPCWIQISISQFFTRKEYNYETNARKDL